MRRSGVYRPRRVTFIDAQPGTAPEDKIAREVPAPNGEGTIRRVLVCETRFCFGCRKEVWLRGELALAVGECPECGRRV